MSLDFQRFVLALLKELFSLFPELIPETSVVRIHATDKKIEAAYIGEEIAKNHVSVKTSSLRVVPKAILFILPTFRKLSYIYFILNDSIYIYIYIMACIYSGENISIVIGLEMVR